MLLQLCEYCWTRESREVPRTALIALLGLGADPTFALRFYNSTDWVKEYKTDKYYTTFGATSSKTVSKNPDGTTSVTTVQQLGKTVETPQTHLWSSSIKKKTAAPSTFAILDDSPRWRG